MGHFHWNPAIPFSAGISIEGMYAKAGSPATSVPVPRAGVIRHLAVNVGTSTNTSALTVVVKINGLVTPLSVVFAPLAVGTLVDAVTVVPVVAGDLVQFEASSPAGAGASDEVSCSCIWDAMDVAAPPIHALPSVSGTPFTAIGVLFSVESYGSQGASAPFQHCRVPFATALNYRRLAVSIPPGYGNGLDAPATVSLAVGGAAFGPGLIIPPATTGNFDSGPILVPIPPLALLSFLVSSAATVGTLTYRIGAAVQE